MGYEDEPVVSQDFIGDEKLFDVMRYKTNDNFFKIISWYDNECGYSSKLISLAQSLNTFKMDLIVDSGPQKRLDALEIMANLFYSNIGLNPHVFQLY